MILVIFLLLSILSVQGIFRPPSCRRVHSYTSMRRTTLKSGAKPVKLAKPRLLNVKQRPMNCNKNSFEKKFTVDDFDEWANHFGLPTALSKAHSCECSELDRLMLMETYQIYKYDDPDVVGIICTLMSQLAEKEECLFLKTYWQHKEIISPNHLVSPDGTTALMLACKNNMKYAVNFLLSFPWIDVTIQNIHDETAIHLAEKHNNTECVSLINAYLKQKELSVL